MALWDLCGKAYNVPAWQLLGGRYRDKVRLYADTPEANSPDEQKKLINKIRHNGIPLVKFINKKIKKLIHLEKNFFFLKKIKISPGGETSL